MKVSIYSLIADLHQMNLEAMKKNLLVIKGGASGSWGPFKDFTTHAIRSAESNLNKLIDCAPLVNPQSGSKVNFQNLAKAFFAALRSNEALMLNSTLFDLHAGIEMRKSGLAPYTVIGSSSKACRELKIHLERLEGRLLNLQRDLFHAVGSKASSDALTTLCLEKGRVCKEMISALANMQAEFCLIARKHRLKGVVNAVEQLGAQLARANHLVRECINTLVSSHILMFLGMGVNVYASKELDDLIKKVDQMPFDIPFPNGKDIEISKLKAQPEDKYVEVEGFVRSIETTVIDGSGMASIIKLEDISNYHSLRVVLPYVNVVNYGLTQGCFCSISGHVKHNNPKANHPVALFGEKLKLATELKKAWRIAFLDLAKPIYTCWPNGINMNWSIKVLNK